MLLLTELDDVYGSNLQRCRAYGAGRKADLSRRNQMKVEGNSFPEIILGWTSGVDAPDLPASGNQLFSQQSDMLNYLKFKFALAKLYREKRRMIEAYHRALHAAQTKRESREQIANGTSGYGAGAGVLI